MTKEISKLLSYVLRHAPEHLDLALDANGWTSVATLITRIQATGLPMDRQLLEHIVASSDKQRFTLSDDGQRIRAAQGHSVKVDLALEPSTPPPLLFHGTAQANLTAILAEGLEPGQRQHVHLSSDEETALRVGGRHGKPVVLRVDAARMFSDGLTFWQAENGVWLTDRVPAAYLTQGPSQG